ALVLLRFPDAPPDFRRGVAHILLEEQSHLRRYQARMHALGVELGDVPVSDFFWSTMADMCSPLDFVVRMSMTFEQANLDHAQHYANLFRQVEDIETAELMDVVYQEEIGHVKHGVHWFNQWRHTTAAPADESDWQAYNRLLPAPLSARRAKGQPYLFEARQRVGLSETFARELEVFSHSRGRPPVVWLFEPNFEAQQASEITASEKQEGTPRAVTTGRQGRSLASTGVDRRIANDLASVLMFEAGSDDIVVTPNRPRRTLLTALTRAGFAVPELLACSVEEAAAALKSRTISGVEGWGETATVRALRATKAMKSPPAHDPNVASKTWAAHCREDFRRAYPHWAPLLGPTICDGRACSSVEEVIETQRLIKDERFDELIVKHPFSTSGQARRRFSVDDNLAEDRWLFKSLASGRRVLVEPWVDGVANISVLLNVTESDVNGAKPIRVPAMPFLTSRSGMYRGHILGDATHALPPSLGKKLAYGAAGGFAGRLAELAAYVRTELARRGHRGPAGIDAMVYRPPGTADAPAKWVLQPIVEINARRTMGHIALALRRRVAPGRFAVWLHRPRRSHDAKLVDEWPSIETTGSGRRPQLSRGLIATTDPASACQVWSFMAVGADPVDVQDLIRNRLDDAATLNLDSTSDAGAPPHAASGQQAPAQPSLPPSE
ncbi:MAG: DUF455 family protein, partial [Myxococcota bacterium]